MKPRRTSVLRIAAASIAAGLSGGALVYGLLAIFADGTASATPGRGFTSTVIARGTFTQNYTFGIPALANVTRKVRVKTKRGVVTKQDGQAQGRLRPESHYVPTDEPLRHRVSAGDRSAGRSSGWHTHPGATFVAVGQGEGTIYRVTGSTCASEKIGVGTGFAQMPTELHVVRNEGSVPFIVYTLYVLPRGTPNSGIRIDQPQPSVCPDIN